jgi:hypothetical protein
MSEARKPWLFGPVQDLLWGSGLAYLTIFLLLLVAGQQVRAVAPQWFIALLVVLLSMPHYGATLLRVYESPDDRRRYRSFALYTTLLFALLFLWGLSNVTVASLLFTLYLTWSPWHYTGQNYGIALMLLGRQGVHLPPAQKRLLHWSFVLSFAVTLFFVHGPSTTSIQIGPQVAFLSLGIPALAADVLIFCSSIAYLLVTGRVVASLWVQGGRRSSPALLLMLTQAVWFVLQTWVCNWIPYSDAMPLSRQFVSYSYAWIALAHAVQYLWVSYFFVRRSGRTTHVRSFYVKALMAGCAAWTVPALLFAPGALGRLPYDAGLAGLVAALVNLHHFVLDGAIWKLRDRRIAAIFFLGSGPPAELPERTMSRPLWPVVAAVGALSLFVHVAATIEEEFGLKPSLSRQDLDRAEVALDRLAWLGRESAVFRETVGIQARRAGDLERSERQLRTALATHPTSERFVELGDTLSERQKWQEAAEAYRRATELDGGNKEAVLLLALAHAELGEHREAWTIATKPELDQMQSTVRSRRLRSRLSGMLAHGAKAEANDSVKVRPDPSRDARRRAGSSALRPPQESNE